MASAVRFAASLGMFLALSAGAQGPAGVTAIFQDGAFPTSRYAGTSDVIITEHDDFDGDPGTNYSDRAYLQVDGFTARHSSLLRFPADAGALPAGATITGASLSIFVRDPSVTGPAFYELLRPWEAGQATYLHARTGEPWAGGGASLPGVDRGSEVIATVPPSPVIDGWTAVPFTDAGVELVRRWFSGSSPNHGLVAQDFGSWDGLNFDSAKGPNPPELQVAYDVGGVGAQASFTPSADTMLAYEPPSFDGWGVGASGRGGELSASLIRWDLTAIPPGVTVVGAELGVTVNRGGSTNEVNPFFLYTAEKPWTEQADWRTYDGQSSWSAPGASGQADHGNPELDTLEVCPDAGQRCAFDLTLTPARSVIEGWANTPAGNRGFLIQNYSNADELQLFDSEAPVVQHRPRLVVSFTWPSSFPTALFPATAEVITGERVQMTAFGGSGGYVFSVTGRSGASIDPSGRYVAGRTPGLDVVEVRDQDGAGTSATSVILVHQGPSGPDAGWPADGGSGGGGLPVTIQLGGPADAVAPGAPFTITADITNEASFTLYGMTLALSPVALTVNAPTHAGAGLEGNAVTGYELPDLLGGQTVQVAIPVVMTATPASRPSLTATVLAGGSPVTSVTLPVELGTPPSFQTGCKCDVGAGGLPLVMAALGLARALRRRRR